MQQLTGLDASFLAFETANSTGHVGGVSVLDPGEAPKPLTLARLTEVLSDRLQLVPVLRRKLLNVPLGLDQPYWIDDADFDIEYHVRELAVPSPGSDAQLYPVSVITDGQGLNITLVGYLGQLHFGLVSCRELVPDIDTLAGFLVDELELLLKAADQRAAG